ncbi:MAG: 3-hydroxyacyl-CoA dehydrogenase NAD-binding domain-containing protein [Candidatus Freyarchaeota archaeon]|nr:3-hydroxyacyl-CoA dehydrogenase NAD-binding domain-containing protein [Candidatus Freyrarchaeum guaymaensis]
MSVKGIERVACVGAGTIGHSWALRFAMHGLKVNLYDVSEEALKGALQRVRDGLQTMVEAGVIGGEDVGEVVGRIKTHADLADAVKGSDYVQESAPEDLNLKRGLFREISRHCPPHAILASSSSTIPISRIAKGLNDPSRCIIVHPINPPHIIPLVELVPGPETAGDVVEAVRELCLKVDMVPIVVRKEVPGHVINRLRFALLREAIDLALKEVASVEDIEKAISHGLGVRWALMGEFLISHLMGSGGAGAALASYKEALEYVFRDLASWKELPKEAFTPRALTLLAEGLKAEIGGRGYDELVRWRDRKLLEILRVKRT